MENVTIKHNGEEYNIDSATLEKCKVIPKPTYDRMEVLRGEWSALRNLPYGHPYWRIIPGTTSIEMQIKSDLTSDDSGIKRFPTRELAEEYLLIAEGEWLPKKGDRWCGCSRKDFSHSWIETSSINAYEADNSQKEQYYLFPSVRQLNEFIQKNKPVRPLAGKEVSITVDGTVYKATLQ